MYNLYLDPFLLACPQANVGINEFENYIDKLISWGEEIDKIKETGFASVYLSAKTPEILERINGYPEWDEVERVIKHLNMQDVVHPHDIFVLIDSLIKLPLLEDKLGINEILLDNIKCDPSYHLTDRDEIFVENYHRLIILIFLFCQFENIEQKNQLLITRHTQSENIPVSVEAEIIDCEFCSNSPYMTLPCKISGCLQSFVDINSLYIYLDPIYIWINANCEANYKNALTLYVIQLNYQLNLKYEIKYLSWSFGVRFLKTINTLGFIGEPTKVKMLLRACGETILKENLAGTHWLRTGKGANNPQKKRKKDSAKAWRRDIDREYHLHYWETPSGIEFASVVVHNDMKIPE